VKFKSKLKLMPETLMYIFACSLKADIEKGSTWMVYDKKELIYTIKDVKRIETTSLFTDFMGLRDGRKILLGRLMHNDYTLLTREAQNDEQ